MIVAGASFREVASDLSTEDRFQLELCTNAFVHYREDAHYQFRADLYDREDFDRQRAAWQETLDRTPPMRNQHTTQSNPNDRSCSLGSQNQTFCNRPKTAVAIGSLEWQLTSQFATLQHGRVEIKAA